MASARQSAIRSFNRYELKYVIHASQLEALIADVSRQMVPDRHGDACGSYTISNLYYDSSDLQMLNSKIIGTKYRRKLRVRVYGEASSDASRPAMVEIKQRLGRTTQKRRVVMSLGDALRLCEGSRSYAWDDPADAQVADEVASLVMALQLRPVCTISYRRRAFVGSRFEPGVRLTFDTELWGAPPRIDFSRPERPGYLMPRDWSIVEIKVDERVPVWVSDLVTQHDCQLRRVSKYCLGMVHLGRVRMPVGTWIWSHRELLSTLPE